MDSFLTASIVNPAYLNSVYRDNRGKIYEIVANFKNWVDFFIKYYPNANSSGQLTALKTRADGIVKSLESKCAEVNCQVGTPDYINSWTNGIYSDAQGLPASLEAVLAPMVNYATNSGNAGTWLANVETRKATLNTQLNNAIPFSDEYNKLKAEKEAYEVVTNKLGKVNFQLEALINNEIYKANNPVVATATMAVPSDTRALPIATNMAVTDALITGTPNSAVVSSTAVSQDRSVANEMNTVSNTTNTNNTSTDISKIYTEERVAPPSQIQTLTPVASVQSIASTARIEPLSVATPPIVPTDSILPPVMTMGATSTASIASTMDAPVEKKGWFKTLWENHKIWVIVGGVTALFIIAGTIWYLIDSDKDREERRVNKLKQQKAKLEGKVEGTE